MDNNFKSEQEIAEFLAGKKRPVQKIKRVQFPELVKTELPPKQNSISKLGDLKLDVIAEIGRTDLTVKQLLGLKIGDTIELDKPVGELADIYINEQRFALGEVLLINDVFGIRMNLINTGREEAEKEEG